MFLGKILLHLNFLILIAYNLVTYIFQMFNLKFSVLISATIMGISFFVAIIQGAFSRRVYSKYLPLVIFVAYILLNVLITDIEGGVFKFLVFLFRGLFGILVVESFLNLGYRLDSRFVILIGLLISAILIYNSSLNEFQFRTSVLMNESGDKSRIVGVIEDSRTLIFIIVYFIFILQKKFIHAVILIVFLLGLIFTQTRQSLLVVAIIIIPFIFFNSSKENNFKYISYLMIFIISIPFLFQYFLNFSIDFETMFRIDSIERDMSTDDFGRFRLMNWAINLFSEKPFLGWGFGFTDYKLTYPHNITLEILAELGAIGLILFFWFFFARIIYTRNLQLRLLIIIFFFLAQFSGNLSQNYLLFFVLVLDKRIFESNNHLISKQSQSL